MENFIKKLLEKPEDPIRKIEIYSYRFPDGKIYIGYTTHGLDDAYKDDKFCEASPVCQYLNNPETDTKPRLEKTVMERAYSDEIYKHEREILDKCGIDPRFLLNKNLKCLGYDVT